MCSRVRRRGSRGRGGRRLRRRPCSACSSRPGRIGGERSMMRPRLTGLTEARKVSPWAPNRRIGRSGSADPPAHPRWHRQRVRRCRQSSTGCTDRRLPYKGAVAHHCLGDGQGTGNHEPGFGAGSTKMPYRCILRNGVRGLHPYRDSGQRRIRSSRSVRASSEIVGVPDGIIE